MAKKPKPYTKKELEQAKKDKEFAEQFADKSLHRREKFLPNEKKLRKRKSK